MLSRIITAARAQRSCVAAANRITAATAAASSNRMLTTMMHSAAAFRFVPQGPRSSLISAVAAVGSAGTVRRVHLSAQPQQQQQQQPSRFEGPTGWAAPPRPPAEFADHYPPLRMPAAPTPWSARAGVSPLPASGSGSDRISVRTHLLQWCVVLLLYMCLWAWGTAPDAEDEKPLRAARLRSWPKPIAWAVGMIIEGWIENGITCRRHFPQLAEFIYPRTTQNKPTDQSKRNAAATAGKSKEAERKDDK